MKEKMKKWGTIFLAVCMIIGCFPMQKVNAEEETVTPSNVYYDVVIRDKTFVFISNKTAVDWKVGDSYFITYTVKKVDEDKTAQSGLCLTRDRDKEYPYLDGTMHMDQKSLLLDEGYTYFLRFDVTENGFEYTAGKAKGDESSYVKFPYPYKDTTISAPYFGIWLGEGEGASVELTKVQCYDKNGKDLGIYSRKASNISISEMKANPNVNHRYEFSVKGTPRFAFGSLRASQSDAFFLEYTIRNVEAKDVDQSGAIMTNGPTDPYPHASVGYLNLASHKSTEECDIITEGAHYLVRFERGETGFEVLVKRTKTDGNVDYFTFPYYAGKYDKSYGYVMMWIGNMCSVSADFTNVKCYDENGNNLGIQTNNGSVQVEHFGDLEDYSQCEAVYYCKNTNTYISLENDCVASKRIDGEESAVHGTYSIADSVLSLTVGQETKKFDYLYEYFTDEEDNKYVRLREWKVTYVSRQHGGEVLDVVTVSAENGFKVLKPENPTREGHQFLSWVEGNGKEYDFDQVVTDAKTLYAKWDGDEEWTLTNFLEQKGITKANPVVIVASCVVIVGGTVAGIVLIRKGKGRKNAKQN